MKTLFHYRLSIALVAFITLLCLLPIGTPQIGGEHTDWVVHGLMFFTLTTCYLIEAQLAQLRRKPYYYLIAFMIALFLGATTELLQKYGTSVRHGDYQDFVCDMTGCCVAMALHLCYAPSLKSLFTK